MGASTASRGKNEGEGRRGMKTFSNSKHAGKGNAGFHSGRNQKGFREPADQNEGRNGMGVCLKWGGKMETEPSE